MTLARSVLLALIGLALLAMPLTAAAREHQRLKHAYQEFDSNDYPVFVCDEDSDDFRPVPWDGSDGETRMNASRTRLLRTRLLNEAGLRPSI